MQSAFRGDPEVLSRGLFTLYGARQGAHTVLNVNFLPDLLHYIKQQLTSQQILRLQDYHLQNYLVQLSIGYAGKPDLASLLKEILEYIRGSNHFWYRHNNQQVIDEEQQLKHTAIHQYHKDMAVLREDFKEEESLMEVFTPVYARKTTVGFCYRILHQNCEPYFGTRHCLNHIAYIPSFLIKKYAQSITQQGQSMLNLNPAQDQKLKLMRECIIFLLSNKQSQAPQTGKNSSGSSENGEGGKSNEQLQSSPEQPNQQHSSIMDQFLEFVEKIPVLPTFHNSHHMHCMTYNILQISHKIIGLFEQPEQPQIQEHLQVNEKGVVEVINLPKDSKQVLSSLSDRELQENQCDILAATFLRYWRKILSSIHKQLDDKQNNSTRGWLDLPQQIEAIKESYQQMLVKPQFLQLTNYRAHGTGVSWKEEDYLQFLKGLAQYINIPTNNKKIAAFMGDKIEPNHVKHVKGLYLTAMKDRMEAGECGGGKRGKCLSKTEFLQRDIATFSMRYFQKNKKIRKRKPKRKRKNSFSDQFEDDADSQY